MTGPNLKKRIEAILAGDVRSPLSAAKKAVIAAAGFLAVVGPIALGVMNPRSLRADSLILPDPRQPRVVFEVVSMKPVDRALMTRNHEGNRLDQEVFIGRTELYTYIIQA